MASEIESTLEHHNQKHLLQFVGELDDNGRNELEAQVRNIDFGLVKSLFQKFGKADAWAELAKRAQPPVALRLADAGNSIQRDDAMAAGKKALSENKVALILVAGGQGSRLGFEHPKGMYPLGPVSKRTLFQIHLDKLHALNNMFGCTIPVYVMTSPATNQETIDFLDENEWFGYPKEAVHVFCQGTMPAVDCQTGKVLLADKGRLFASPDGHGGMLAALDGQGCLADMEHRGIEQVFYGQIDNPLSLLCDPTTIGYHILAGSEMSSQAVPKIDPLQKVGNIVSIDEKVQIIEYSDLPESVARKTDDSGELTFWAGNIAVHVFNVEFLSRMKEHADALPFHLAHKKVPFVDSNGKVCIPEEPNAIKFERFIFDLLPMASHSIVIEVDPIEAFSPVKNAATESSNTAATAQQAMVEQAKRRLSEIDVRVADEVQVELHPALMFDSSKLTAVVKAMGGIVGSAYISE